MVLREFLFFFALALTTYDALQNSPPKVSDVPQALPFFEKGSLVTDWYKGELSKAFSSIAMFDVSFVMYYAPWDAECQHVKHEFDKAAQIMFKQVHFTAINCWNPGGECRLHHNHISVWPIIIAHTNLLKTLIYNGPMDSMSMVKFLQQVIKPLTRLTTSDSLIELVSICDAVVVGFTPMDNDTLAYNIFYNVALKNLELDPFANVCFGIVTSEKLAVEIGVKTLPHVKLVLWNDTLEYPSMFPFNEENISNWIVTRTYRHAFWVMPSWHKSFKMQGLFAQGPVLVLFTPRNHFYDQTPNYDLLREVALEYNNCGNSLIKVMTKLRTIQRHKYIEYERDKLRICKNLDSLSSGTTDKAFSQKIYQNEPIKNVWLNKTTCKKSSPSKQFQLFSLSEESYLPAGMEVTHEELLGLNGYCVKTEESSCFPEFETSNFFSNYDDFENNVINKLSVSESTASIETSMLDMGVDPRSSINLQKQYLKELCAKIELAAEVSPQPLPVLNGNNPKIEGLQCETNSSLSFIAIDSLVNHYFAESLGINISNKTDKTAVVIIDGKHETQYLLEKPFGEKSIREFVFNFTMNLIPRDLRSTVGSSKHTHYFGSDKVETPFNDVTESVDKSCQKKSVSIEELNTLSFREFISQKNKALLVTLCGGGSGSCGGLLSLTLLSVAHSFLELREHIQVARLDASVNDLPWEYTVSKYPTLMFFPAGKKENSRTYPENRPITVEGVLAFVLSGLDTPIKLHAKVLLCNQTMDNYDMKKCLTNIRRSVVDLIGNTLRHWRRTQDSAIKNILLRRLQCLRAVAINLGALNTTKVPSTHPIYKQFSESITTLSNIWKTTVPTLRRRQNHTLDYENL